jgi:oligopeptide/dipeptide ABC transporter ATP-binding protein
MQPIRTPGTDVGGNAVLDIEDLHVHFLLAEGSVRAVNGVSLRVAAHRTFGIVGESGCGKSVTALSTVQLIKMPPGKIVAGRILLHRDGSSVDLAKLPRKGRELRRIRGNEIAVIFQDPMSALHPMYHIGEQIAEGLRRHRPELGRAEQTEIVLQMLASVGLPNPSRLAEDYPHNLSGGMRQRAMIALALACNPRLLIADEPTTALDVTVQARILSLIDQLQEEFGMAVILISHDLAVIAENADEMAVMYLGEIVESGSVDAVFSSPLHPYTLGLFQSIPALQRQRRAPLNALHGSVPGPYEVPRGCVFKDRCPFRHAACEREPPLVEPEPGHAVKCWLYGSPP